MMITIDIMGDGEEISSISVTELNDIEKNRLEKEKMFREEIARRAPQLQIIDITQ